MDVSKYIIVVQQFISERNTLSRHPTTHQFIEMTPRNSQ
jgi:hypothetical protein